MSIKLLTLPKDSMWWIIRPEFIGFIDNVIMDKRQFQFEETEKDKSGYHKLAWDRLNVLIDEDVLNLIDVNLPEKEISEDANQITSDILANAEYTEQFINDLIFAYKYWIDFNILKIELLPDNQDYGKLIEKNMKIWKEDLCSLIDKKQVALYERPNIMNYVGKNILEKVLTLDYLNNNYNHYPMSSLKEYEPFLKWINMKKTNPLVTEKTVLSYQNNIISSTSKNIDLPIEPEYDFLRFRLSKLSFKKRLRDIKEMYFVIRTKLTEYLNKSQDVVFGISESKYNQKVTEDLINLNCELKNISSKKVKLSSYLSTTFAGLSFIPIPILSQFFNIISMGSKEISNVVIANELLNKNLRPKGLSAYISFLEGMIDHKKYDKFPDIQKDNYKLKLGEKPFWRTLE